LVPLSSISDRRNLPMSEANKAVVRRVLEEVWSGGKLDLVDELLSPDFVRYGPPTLEGVVRGPEGFKQLVTMYRTVYPDLQVPIEALIAEADTIVVRWTARGTHRAELMGISPSGKQVAVAGVIIDRVAGGKIAEEWACYDGLGMLQQLGAFPSPAPGGS
jgi:steroid delta-isomerase-like uncharacterized protein